MIKYKVEGVKELEKSLKKLGDVPQKFVTKAAKQGSTILLKKAKQGGWIDRSGNLRKGIILKGEKTKLKGKKVYQVTFDTAYNDVFVKVTKTGKRAYYPASQEYGFRTRNGGYVPGFHFMKNAVVEKQTEVERKIIDVMSKAIDKALK
ncbi:MAG: hypothetical protein KatS3mg079_679 [Caloramator sp.]|nr:MAG: hypothetical protein KatS3mg079_679 [Caloramator sp.]